MVIYFIEWCRVITLEDEKQHVVHSKTLETESCEFVTDHNLYEGKELIWRYNGLPYTVEVQEVHGKLANFVSQLAIHSFLISS